MHRSSVSQRELAPGRRGTLAPEANDGVMSDRIQQIVTRLRLVTAPSRQMILLLLAEGEQSVGEICDVLNNPSQPAVSHQLSLLRHGRLVEGQRRGRKVFYQLTDSGRAVTDAFATLSESRNLSRPSLPRPR